MPEPVPPPLNLALSYLRRARGWTQQELAAAAGIKSHQMVCDFEKGKRRPLTREMLETLVGLMGYTQADLTLALLFLGGLSPAGREVRLSPVDPTPAELHRAGRIAGRAGLQATSAMHAHLLRLARARRLERARQQAACLWEAIRGASPAKQREVVERSPRFHAWAFAVHLCAESVHAAADSVERALHLARLALRVAELAPGPDGWRLALQGYAWAFVANAQRVGSDLREAEASFATAWRLWRAGQPVPAGLLGEWRLLDLEASLRRGQRQFSVALELLDRALALAPAEFKGRILLNRAFTLEQAGETSAALVTLQEAAPLVDAAGDLRLRFGVRFNATVILCHLGQHSKAEASLPALEELTAKLGNQLDLVRLLWLSGRVAAGLGHRRQHALAAFEQAAREFAELGDAYNTALVSLDLAILYLDAGRDIEVAALAEQMLWIFDAQGVHREALAALRLFCEAVRGRSVTAELATRVRDYLERARGDPGLRFDAGVADVTSHSGRRIEGGKRR
jgi:transcriptional regulator with XRE-family HTH domain